MKDNFIIQYIYRSRYSVVIDDDVYVHKHEKYKFDQPFLSFQLKYIFIGKSKLCELTEFSGVDDSSDFDGNTTLLECVDNEYVYFSGYGSFIFKTDDKNFRLHISYGQQHVSSYYCDWRKIYIFFQ